MNAERPARQRLDKLLSSRGYCSRREARDLIRSGAVTVEGFSDPGVSDKVLAGAVRIDGEPIDPETLTLALHKQAGYTCSRSEEPSVYTHLPQRYLARDPGIESVGRLDKDTTGLLLFTDDGQLLHRITSPKKHVAKYYVVTLAKPLRGDESAVFRSGTLLLDGEKDPCLPAELQPRGEREALVILREGRYHQIKRMFEALGNSVECLHRCAIGGLTIEDIPEGEFKILTEADIQRIFE
jgi:16S rRNA pseudouridine516 synthase